MIGSYGQRSKHTPAWAIVRVDATGRKETPFSRVVTVKKVVLTEAYARAEAERLNTMNAAKGVRYVVQLTELDESVVPGEEE